MNPSSDKTKRINLGLAISGASLTRGQTRTLREIAAYCECDYKLIAQIETRALRKIRAALNRLTILHSHSATDGIL